MQTTFNGTSIVANFQLDWKLWVIATATRAVRNQEIVSQETHLRRIRMYDPYDENGHPWPILLSCTHYCGRIMAHHLSLITKVFGALLLQFETGARVVIYLP